MKFTVLIFCVTFTSAFTAKLPSYIPKCSLSQQDLQQCITQSANLAIPKLVKGDASLDIPVLSPLQIPELNLFSAGFELALKDVNFDGFKDFVVTASNFDLANKKLGFAFTVKYLNFSSEYQIDDGQILTRSVNGGGKFEMSLVGNVIRYRGTIDKFQKDDGNEYYKVDERRVELTTERAYYNFEGLVNLNEEGEDIYLFLENHWEEVNSKVQPGLVQFFQTYIDKVFDGFVSNVPANDLFLE